MAVVDVEVDRDASTAVSRTKSGPERQMLINMAQGAECRIAVIENGRLEELYTERASTISHVGNIYLGKVTNVEPSIQAAFIDFGIGQNGFLHISDVLSSYFKKGSMQERVGKKHPRHTRPPIQECLSRGDEVMVQVIKEGIGTKGPTLTTYLSIPGRFLVLMPGMNRLGVSRKIEDDNARKEARQLLNQLSPPEDAGFIIRTAGVGRTKTELQQDLNYLLRLWTTIQKKKESGPAPHELYEESDLVVRTLRDVLSNNITKIICDQAETLKTVRDFLSVAMPRGKTRTAMHEGPKPLFAAFGIEREIEHIRSRHLPLASGGSLVFDSTEALVAIDVNSGKNRSQ